MNEANRKHALEVIEQTPDEKIRLDKYQEGDCGCLCYHVLGNPRWRNGENMLAEYLELSNEEVKNIIYPPNWTRHPEIDPEPHRKDKLLERMREVFGDV